MSHWDRFQKYFVRYSNLGFSIDISRMAFEDDIFAKMAPRIESAYKAMIELEGGAIAKRVPGLGAPREDQVQALHPIGSIHFPFCSFAGPV